MIRLLPLLLAWLAACGGEPIAPAFRDHAQSIVGGGPAPSDHAAVALVARRAHCLEPKPMLLCSGALVGPDLVLTAAHCLDIFGEDGQYEIFFGEALPEGRYIRVREAWRHPSYDAGTHAFDVALLRLAAPVDITPWPLPPRDGAAPSPGATARAIGYGETRDAATPPGRRLQGDTVITGVQAASFRAAPAPSMSCTGDSGGPVLVDLDGKERLAGITVSGDVACASEAVAVRVDALLDDFLGPALAESPRPGAPPTLAPEALCTAACESGADCPFGLACVPDATGIGRCLLHQLQAGSYEGSCSDDAACGTGGRCARLAPEGPDACRCFEPCAPPPDPPAPEFPSGGCSSTNGAGAWTHLALLLLAAHRLSRSPARASFVQPTARRPPL